MLYRRPHVIISLAMDINIALFSGILDRGAKYRDVYNFALDHIERKDDVLPNTRIVPYYRDINSNPITISERGNLPQSSIVEYIISSLSCTYRRHFSNKINK